MGTSQLYKTEQNCKIMQDIQNLTLDEASKNPLHREQRYQGECSRAALEPGGKATTRRTNKVDEGSKS